MVQILVATPLFAESVRGERLQVLLRRQAHARWVKVCDLSRGRGHAEFFYGLAEREGRQGEALATFVRGKGYVGFESNRGAVLPVGGWGD